MFKYITHSKKGLRRERNQDRIFILDKENYVLFCVFDGVSSVSTSHVFIKKYVQKIRSNISNLLSSGANLPILLYESHCEVLQNNANLGMSTLSVLFYDKLNKLTYNINIGDSRIYLFTNQFIEKITIDDSLSNTPNVLTRCLGTSEISLDDFLLVEIPDNYNYLICSDGFYKLMEANLMEYFETFNFKKPTNIRKKLSSLQRGKNNDDSSYILIKHEVPSRN